MYATNFTADGYFFGQKLLLFDEHQISQLVQDFSINSIIMLIYCMLPPIRIFKTPYLILFTRSFPVPFTCTNSCTWRYFRKFLGTPRQASPWLAVEKIRQVSSSPACFSSYQFGADTAYLISKDFSKER